MAEHIEICELTEADFSQFQEIETLELLLGLFTDERSQELARLCQCRFGSFLNLVGASSKALREAGLPMKAILTIKIIGAVSRRVAAEPTTQIINGSNLSASNN